eukprot:7379624-Prymnesium_polylepis.1
MSLAIGTPAALLRLVRQSHLSMCAAGSTTRGRRSTRASCTTTASGPQRWVTLAEAPPISRSPTFG